ncbi:hypothetical protein BY458DRAFT_13302 [Sporodiniella umbellata]|nr:hypothetical protein BY458DRAFT_13302 [Sporodiniella umbellata]
MYIIPEDFISILEEVTAHHAGLQFLYSNPMFQERYIETVICRIYYDARCFTGQMYLSQFRQTKFLEAIESLQGHNDLNKIRNCFSYKYFYVLYCRFWAIDQDHDLLITKNDLLNYNGGILSDRLINQVIQFGKVPAFLKKDHPKDTLSYLDYVCK